MAGLDNISSDLIQKTFTIIYWASNLLDKPFLRGVFHNKCAKGISIFKSGDGNIENNYQTIDIFSTLSKALEEFVQDSRYSKQHKHFDFTAIWYSPTLANSASWFIICYGRFNLVWVFCDLRGFYAVCVVAL